MTATNACKTCGASSQTSVLVMTPDGWLCPRHLDEQEEAAVAAARAEQDSDPPAQILSPQGIESTAQVGPEGADG